MNIQEFALKIGVSTATVSRAIHGNGRISRGTKEMVLLRMKELDYTPNLHAQRLVTNRSGMIALAFQDDKHLLRCMFSLTLASVIEQALNERRFGLLLNLMDEPDGQNRVLRGWVASRAVDGVLLEWAPNLDHSLVAAISKTVPVVMIGHEAVTGFGGAESVLIGLDRGARQVARLLAELGHRRIGFLGSLVPDMVLMSFRDELAACGIALPNSNIRFAGIGYEAGAQAITDMLKESSGLTAVFCRTDMLAIGAMRAVRDLGLRVPHDISIVGHDDTPIAPWLDPPLTSVRIDCDALANTAVEVLYDLMNGVYQGGPTPVVNTELIQRNSVAAPVSSKNGMPSMKSQCE